MYVCGKRFKVHAESMFDVHVKFCESMKSVLLLHFSQH